MATRTRTNRALSYTALFAGLAWVTDVSVIIAINNSFGLLDSVLFLTGLCSFVAAAVLAVVVAARRRRGAARFGVAVASVAALAAATWIVSTVGDALAHSLIASTNHGHTEGAVLALGLAALIAGATLTLRTQRSAPVGFASAAP